MLLAKAAPLRARMAAALSKSQAGPAV